MFGTDAVADAIDKKKVKLVIVAKDASERTRNNFKFICEKNQIPIFEFEKIETLSKCIGKSNKAVIGIKEKNFSEQIIKNINGGDLL